MLRLLASCSPPESACALDVTFVPVVQQLVTGSQCPTWVLINFSPARWVDPGTANRFASALASTCNQLGIVRPTLSVLEIFFLQKTTSCLSKPFSFKGAIFSVDRSAKTAPDFVGYEKPPAISVGKELLPSHCTWLTRSPAVPSRRRWRRSRRRARWRRTARCATRTSWRPRCVGCATTCAAATGRCRTSSSASCQTSGPSTVSIPGPCAILW